MQKHIRIIEHPQIGELTLIADYKYKGIRYCVSTQKNKILFNPLYIDRVLPLSDDTINWFINSKQKIRLKYPSIEHFAYSADTVQEILTFRIIFAVEEKLKDSLSAQLNKDILTIRYPIGYDFGREANQRAIKNVIKHFTVLEAKRILPDRLHRIADQYGFCVNSVRISVAKMRWGSCSNRKVVALSAYLLFLPNHLVDFVIVHELCHTLQMNHGKEFYDELGKIYPQYKTLDKELKTIGREVSKYF